MDKQIIDIAKIIGDDYCEIFDDGQGQDCGLDCTICRARRLYDSNYRKIPENAVVLTAEEYERWQGQTVNIKKVRKETAEKFAESFKQKMKDKYQGSGIWWTEIVLMAIEICKEITGEN